MNHSADIHESSLLHIDTVIIYDRIWVRLIIPCLEQTDVQCESPSPHAKSDGPVTQRPISVVASCSLLPDRANTLNIIHTRLISSSMIKFNFSPNINSAEFTVSRAVVLDWTVRNNFQFEHNEARTNKFSKERKMRKTWMQTK